MPAHFKITLVTLVTLLLTACTPKDTAPEQITQNAIRDAIRSAMRYPGTYIPVSTRIDSVFGTNRYTDYIPIRHELNLKDLEYQLIFNKKTAAEKSMSLWEGPSALRPDQNKYIEAKLFMDTMQTLLDSLQQTRDSLQNIIDELNVGETRFLGFIAEHRFAQVNDANDSVYSKKYILLDSTKTTVLDLWDDEVFEVKPIE